MVRVYCDGSIQDGNPGGWAVGGWVIKSEDGAELFRGCLDLGRQARNTNNVAEYAAVWGALATLIRLSHTHEEVVVHSDSQLIIRQLQGEYQCANSLLKTFREIVQRLLPKFPRVTFVWIPREENTEADAQSRRLYADSET